MASSPGPTQLFNVICREKVGVVQARADIVGVLIDGVTMITGTYYTPQAGILVYTSSSPGHSHVFNVAR